MEQQNPAPISNQHPEPSVYDQPPKRKRGGKFNDTLSTIGVILLAPIVAIFLTQFVFQSYQVDGPSMRETLQDRDRLIVTKTGKTWSRVTGKDYIPKRYEIIIFNHTGDFGDGTVAEKQLVKRVIAVPGDRVLVKDNIVRVYNQQHPEGFLVDQSGPEKNTITITPSSSVIDETIKEGQVFVLGDNRTNSTDSRIFGSVNSKDIVGKLNLRIYPFNKFEKF